MTLPTAPLQRTTFNAGALMAEHPPVLRDRNKQVVLEVACPPGSIHAGDITYSRWAALPLPASVSAGDAMPRVLVHEGVYDYAGTSGVEGATAWHVNFADPRLFCSYGSGLFAQDEMQVAEHPALGALKEALEARKWTALTIEKGQPTPVLVHGVERRCRIAIEPNHEEGRPQGLYGNAFMTAPTDVVRCATRRLEPPGITNVIAMAAPYGMRGRYHAKDIEFVLVTAFSGFRAAVLESANARAVVHTGYWGCGAFGGNRVLMSMLQVLAAELAGVERLVFHTVTPQGRAEFDLAMEKMRRDLPGLEVNTPLVIDRIAGMGLRWGASDGN